MAECTYSLDGQHHFGERTFGPPGREWHEIGCRCGIMPRDHEREAARQGLEATRAEQHRQAATIAQLRAARRGIQPPLFQ